MFFFQVSNSDQKQVWFWKLPCRKDRRNTFFVTVSDVSYFKYAQGYVLATKFCFSIFLEPCLSSTASYYWCLLSSLYWKSDFEDRDSGVGGSGFSRGKEKKNSVEYIYFNFSAFHFVAYCFYKEGYNNTIHPTWSHSVILPPSHGQGSLSSSWI